MRIGKQNIARGSNIKLKKDTSGTGLWLILKLAILPIVLLLILIAQNSIVLTKTYIFTSDKIPKTFVDYNIVCISDICNSRLNIANKVSRLKPDVVIFNGGLTDNQGKYDNTLKTIKSLSEVAQTFYVLDNHDKSFEQSLKTELDQYAVNLVDESVTLNANEINVDSFIDKYIGGKICKDAERGDTEAIQYIEYTKKSLAEDADRKIGISGIDYIDSQEGLVDKIYEHIGTDKETFQVFVANPADQFENISKADVDLMISKETSDYKSGIFSSNGTTLFIDKGIAKDKGFRILDFPEITSIRLSDGTIKDENPLEKFLSIFISDVGTKFDNDGGFKEYTYTYQNEYVQD